MKRIVAIFVVTISLQCFLAAQIIATGVPRFSSTTGGPDMLNLGNLNVHLNVPVFSKPGRGIPFSYTLGYDSTVWYPVGASGSQSWQPVSNWGWVGQTQVLSGYMPYTTSTSRCFSSGLRGYVNYTVIHFRGFVDQFGVQHAATAAVWETPDQCDAPDSNPSMTAITHDGYSVYVDDSPSALVTDSRGNQFVPSLVRGAVSGSATDANGNYINTNGSSFTDTLGTTALTISGSNPQSFTFTNSNPSPNNQSTVNVTYSTYTIKTNFGCSGVAEYGPTNAQLISSIGLPDGSSYNFNYETTPGYSGDYTGRLASVQLPTGGTITYAYSGGSNGITCADGTAAGLSRTTPDGTTSYSRSGSGSAWTTTVADATSSHNQTVLSFQTASDGSGAQTNFYETKRQIYSGSSTLLRTIYTCYNGSALDCSSTTISPPIAQVTATTQLDNNYESEVNTAYNVYELPTETDEYDFGNGSPGALLRKTITAYASLGNNIVDRVSSVQVTDGNNNQVAYTSYGYDESTPNPTSGLPQHITVSGSRGNLTSVNQWLNTTGGILTTTLTYEDTGNVLTSKDPNGNTTQFAYSNSDAFVSQVTLPTTGSVQHIVKSTYDSDTGLVLSTTDQNQQVTNYTYDSMMRPTEVDYPDSGKTKAIYTPYTSSSSPAKVETQQYMTASTYVDSLAYLDGLGRVNQTQLTSDPEGTDTVDTVYDAMGRVYYVTNPFRTTSDPTYGATYYFYDALSRPTTVQDQDGNTTSTSYSGPCVTASDETSRQRQLCSDGLGRLTSVTEPNPSSGSLSSGAYPTTYTYDLLNNLKTVTQTGDGSGTRTRSFSYDSLSRMLNASNPESGTVCYGTESSPPACDNNGYDGNGNLLYITDARGLRTTMGYDALNRMTAKNYSNTNLGWAYLYDTGGWGGSSNGIGRLVHATNYVSVAKQFSYDAMGRLNEEWDCLPSNCGQQTFSPMQAGYDLAGNLTSLTYPSGRKITQTYSGAGRLYGVNFASFNSTNVNYSYWAAPYAGSDGWPSWNYFPNGALHIGVPGNQTTEGAGLNTRLQQNQWFTYLPGGGLVADHTVSYYDANNHNNGNVLDVVDALNSNHTQGFTYDYLNRITAAQQVDNSFNQTFNYDPWSNMTQTGVAASAAFNANNQFVAAQIEPPTTCSQAITAYCYDAAGNMTWDTVHSYTFDAESRISAVDSTVTYTYDALGNRVRKDVGGSDPTEYIYFGGVPIAEHDPTTGDWSDYIYANGNRIVKADTFANRIHMSGTNSGAGQYTLATDTSLPTQLTQRQVQTGDKLYVAQYETGGYGGLQVGFTDGTYANSTTGFEDQNGQASENDENQNSWQTRIFAMDAYAGKYISGISLISNSTSPADSWVMYFSNFSYTAPDGSVYPIYTGQSSFSANVGSSSGVSNVVFNVEHDTSQGAYPQYTTTYYHADHLGTSRLITNAWGWPDWQGTFMPFGEEVNPQITTNHYLFTGDEHDTESNLEHTQFRQLSTVQGRWLSPDPYLGSMDLTNPQSLNRYAYVMNGPMGATDPSGLDLVSIGIGDWCDFGLDGAGFPEEDCGNFTWHLPVGADAAGGGGGGGKSSSGTPTQGPGWNTGGKPPLSGEIDGIPNGINILQRGLLAALGVPLPPVCDFGGCIPDLGIGFADDKGPGSSGNNDGFVVGIPPGMNGPLQAAKQATRGYPKTNFPNPQTSPWPKGPPPEINPPPPPQDIPWWKLVPLKILEFFDAASGASGDVVFTPDLCVTTPALKCGPYAHSRSPL